MDKLYLRFRDAKRARRQALVKKLMEAETVDHQVMFGWLARGGRSTRMFTTYPAIWGCAITLIYFDGNLKEMLATVALPGRRRTAIAIDVEAKFVGGNVAPRGHPLTSRSVMELQPTFSVRAPTAQPRA